MAAEVTPMQACLCSGFLHKLRANGSTVASRAPSMLFWISGWSSDDAKGRLSSATAEGVGLGLWL